MSTSKPEGVEYRALHTVRAGPKEENNGSSLDNMEELRRTNAYAYTIACILGEKGRQSLIETGDLEAMLDGGIVNFYQKYSKLVKGLNLQLSTPEIRFDNMGYSVRVPVKSEDTVGRKLRGLVNTFKAKEKKTVVKQILYPMSGVIKPGSTTLVLGRPGCGKTSFLKALAGKLKSEKGASLAGTILYSGLSPEEVLLSKFVGLVDQNDQHCPTLTVRETIQFADYCLNGNHENQPEEVQGVAALRTDLLLHILGLTKQADTVVGDELLRGVSGGEKKRVTIGEMLVGGQSIFLCDEISTGLDSAATFDITKSLKSWTEILGGTVVAALLQPPPEVVDLFDNIVLLSEGRLVYHGPRESALAYFNSLGYDIHSNLDPAEFFIDVVCEKGEEFENHFKKSSIFQKVSAELSRGFELPTLPTETVAFREYYAMTKLAGSRKKGAFALSFYDSLKLLTQRQARVLFRDKSLFYGRLGEAVIMGLLLGSLYYDASKDLYMRMLFFSIAILQRQAWQQITIAFQLREIFYKQRIRNFYPTLAFGIAEAVCQIPINVAISFIMGIPFYYLSGLNPNGLFFIKFILVLISFQHAIGAYFTFLTSIVPTITIAQAAAGMSVCFFLLFSGNIILRDLIPDYWIWMYWFDPIAWGLRAVMINEYDSAEFKPRLEAVNIYYGSEYVWIGIIVLLGYYVFFTFLKSLALHFISFQPSSRSSSGKPDIRDENRLKLAVANESSPLHFTPAYLTIRRLSYSVTVEGKDKVLLENVTAHFTPGTMTALMGASGAGKSTLLDCIAGRKTEGKATGEILVNGKPKDPSTFPRIAAYCEQMDIHSAGITVMEGLLFSALLRLPGDMAHEDKLNFIDEIVEVLGLRDICHCIIGTVQTGGISVEQRKRVTVAVELVANPSIIFLDEPTSGLDARSAVMVMKAVKNICKLGKTVICTIHQPNTQLFYLFDAILLLKRGGRTVYFSHLEDEASNMIEYFASIPGTARIEPNVNPATYILEAIGAGIGRDVKDATDYGLAYDQSELRQIQDKRTDEMSDISYHKEKFPELDPMATGIWNQINLTTRKLTKIYWRSTNYNFVRLVLFPVFAVIFGSTFYQLGFSSFQKVNSQIALIYLTMDFIGVINMMTVLEITCAERAVYYRERSSNMYSALPYAIGLFLAEVPYLLIITALFVEVEYWMVGLSTNPEEGFLYWLIFFIYCSACTFIGQLMSVLLPNPKVANVAVGAISCLLNLFSGYLVSLPNIPDWYYWITYILPSKYALSCLVTTQIGVCSTGNENGCEVIKVGNVTEQVSDYVARAYDFHHYNRYYFMLVLLGMWVFLQVCIYLTLRFVCHVKR